MSRSVRMLALLAALLAFAACRRGWERVVGVVPKGASHILWQTVHADAIKGAGEFGYTVDWNAPPLAKRDSRRSLRFGDRHRQRLSLMWPPIILKLDAWLRGAWARS